MRLLSSFRTVSRVVLLSSDAQWPRKTAMEKYAPTIPDDLELLVKRTVDTDRQGHGYQRCITTWMYALNRIFEKASVFVFYFIPSLVVNYDRLTFLIKDTKFKRITAMSINPDNLVNSDALTTNIPKTLGRSQRFIYKPLLPLLKLMMGPTLCIATPACIDVV